MQSVDIQKDNSFPEARFLFNLSIFTQCMWGKGKLFHQGRKTHIYVGKLTIIGSDNGLSPGRRRAIIWTNAGTWLIWPLGTNFNEILYEILNIFIQENAFEDAVSEMASVLSRPQCVDDTYNKFTNSIAVPLQYQERLDDKSISILNDPCLHFFSFSICSSMIDCAFMNNNNRSLYICSKQWIYMTSPYSILSYRR